MSGNYGLLEQVQTITHQFEAICNKRIDNTDPNKIYLGFAVKGTLPGQAKWAICTIEVVSGTSDAGEIATRWASDYDEDFAYVWGDRAGYTYL